MSRIEDIETLVTKVMGWDAETCQYEGQGWVRFYPHGDRQNPHQYPEHDAMRGGVGWNPFTCADDAMDVIDKMREKWHTEAMTRKNYWAVRMYLKDDEGERGDVIITEIGQTFPEAVCQAALAAIRAEKPVDADANLP